MKPASLGIPGRDIGLPDIRPFGEALLARLEEQNRRLADLEKRLYGRAPTVQPTLAAERVLLDRLDSRTGDAVTLERSRIRDRAADEVYFTAWMSSTIVLYGGPAASAVNGDARVMQFPKAAAGFANITVPTRSLWVGTRPKVTVIYTSPVGSTNTFNLAFSLFPFGPTATTTATSLGVTWSAPGPAAAGAVLQTQATITASRYPSSPFGAVRCRLDRDVADANANALDVILALITFEEVA